MTLTRAILLVCAASPIPAFAQECRSLANPEERLKCYDAKFGAPATTETAPAPPVPAPSATPSSPDSPWLTFLKDVKLRDELTPAGLGANPALLSIGTQNGETFSAVRAALTYKPSISPFGDTLLGEYGWGPFLSGAYIRNTLTSKRVDTRQVNLGLAGTIGDIDALKFALYSNIGFGRKENKVDGITSNTANFDSVVVSDSFRNGTPYKSPFAWFVLPRFGYYDQDRVETPANQPKGHTNSVYGGLRVEAYPGLISDRLRLTGYIQRFVDTQASPGIAKRSDTYYTFGIDYLLYDPRNANEWFLPSLSLTRSIGADPLNSVPDAATTLFSLRLQIN